MGYELHKREMVHDGAGVRDLLYVDMDQLKRHADWCKEQQNTGRWYSASGKDMRVLAEMPAAVVELYIATNGITFAEFMRNPEHANRMLRDPALADFRIHPGGR